MYLFMLLSRLLRPLVLRHASVAALPGAPLTGSLPAGAVLKDGGHYAFFCYVDFFCQRVIECSQTRTDTHRYL